MSRGYKNIKRYHINIYSIQFIRIKILHKQHLCVCLEHIVSLSILQWRTQTFFELPGISKATPREKILCGCLLIRLLVCPIGIHEVRLCQKWYQIRVFRTLFKERFFGVKDIIVLSAKRIILNSTVRFLTSKVSYMDNVFLTLTQNHRFSLHFIVLQLYACTQDETPS